MSIIQQLLIGQPNLLADPHFDFVTLLLNGVGAEGGSVILDESQYNRTPAVNNGTITTSLVLSPYGDSCLHMPLIGNRLEYSSDTWNTLDRDFTLEFWARPKNVDATRRAFFTRMTGATGATVNTWLSYQSGGAPTHDWQFGNGSSLRAAVIAMPVVNTWHFWAISRNGAGARIYRGAVGDALATLVGTIPFLLADSLVNLATNLVISQRSGGAEQCPCYYKSIRLTDGVGRYPLSCPVPIAPFPAF